MMESTYYDVPEANREMMLNLFKNMLYTTQMFSGTLYFAPNAIETGLPAEEFWVSRVGGEESREYKVDPMTGTNDRAWFNESFNNKKLMLTNPYLFNTQTLTVIPNPTVAEREIPTNRFVVSIAAPIVLPDGRVIGVAVIDIRVARFDTIVQTMKPFETGYAVLLATDGTIMSSPAAETVNTNYKSVTYMEGMNPSDIVDSFTAEKTIAGDWYHAANKEAMYLIAVPVDIGGGALPMGLAVTFVTKDARAAVGLNSMLMMSRFVLLFIILIIVGTTFIMRFSIIKYLNQFMEAMRDLTEGDGDLTKQISIHTGDEFEVLAGYLNDFVGNLRRIISDVKNSAEEVASGNNQLAATMEELSTTFGSQSEQVSAVAINMETINDTSKIMVESLGINVTKMGDAKDEMDNGGRQLNVAVSNMNIIKDKTITLGETVEHLADSSNKIGDILGVINDIADQTNLLALNAAIEAARAGDAGRGFAVVADEVRKLAERTQRSTSEISSIIGQLQQETGTASTEMKGAAISVDEGLGNIMKTDEIFKTIVGVVNEIDTTTQEVNGGISDQFDMVQTINDNTQGIASGIEESVHAVDEVAKTVSYLQEKADNLKTIVSRFKV
ncbi:MAG: methyl-accepting chemotaxis protein [Deferribacteraceae bacterium]|jgi:methyl-accepting chemotaxis protein|nr:methyl-accepting chemotaxis protein [Deferribacteraceae bacterium]